VLPAVDSVIVITVFGWSNVAPGFTATDNQTPANTYTSQASNGNAGGEERILTAPVNTSAGTFTVTVTNNGSGSATMTFNVQEWSGVTSTANRTNTNTGTSTTPDTLATATTTVADCALVAATKNDANVGTWSANATNSVPSSGWTLRITETDDGTFGAGATADNIVSATGAYRHVWSQTGLSGFWKASIVALPATAVAVSGEWEGSRIFRVRMQQF
jgi:hypothetical protein